MSSGEIFVKGIWRMIPSEDDTSWVDVAAASSMSDSPIGDYSLLVQKMLNAGLSSHDIARFARIVGYKIAFHICYYLGDPQASYEGGADTIPEHEWDLYEVQGGMQTSPITCVHELLLGADPSGREMRPRLDV